MESFKAHTGEVFSGKQLQDALDHVANWYEDNARAIRKEDRYASHVTEDQKDRNLQSQLNLAEHIRSGKEHGFWLWQRINTYLTGECVPMLK